MAGVNPFSGSSSIAGPASQSVDVSGNQSDTPGTQLPFVVRSLYCTGAGTVKIHVLNDPQGTTRTITLAAGQLFTGFYIDQVYATGTTATGLIGGI